MYDAIRVADEFLRIAKERDEQLTPLQLMKLVYIAHGWSFPVRKQDLFSNRIEAWKYGPVIPDLYHATKQFGRNPIPLDLVAETNSIEMDQNTRKYLENVYELYGSLSGIALSNLTHMSGTPWDSVYEEGVLGKEIPDDLIRQHYEKLYRERQSSTTS